MFDPLPAKEDSRKPEPTSRTGDIHQLIKKFDHQKDSSKDYEKTASRSAIKEIQEVKTSSHATKITNDAIADKISTNVESKKFVKETEKTAVGDESPISDKLIEIYTQRSVANISHPLTF